MKSSFRIVALGTALIGGVACSAERKDVDTAVASTPSVATPAPIPAADASVSSWQVTEYGIGPVRAGMTAREAVATLQGAGVTTATDSEKGCHYLGWSGPAGVRVMIEDGVVARIAVDSGAIATKDGAKIGDSESRIQSLYPNRVTVQPHKYTKGHYLVVAAAVASDSAFRIVFETDGKTVTKYRSGKQPQVSYVEGCS